MMNYRWVVKWALCDWDYVGLGFWINVGKVRWFGFRIGPAYLLAYRIRGPLA